MRLLKRGNRLGQTSTNRWSINLKNKERKPRIICLPNNMYFQGFFTLGCVGSFLKLPNSALLTYHSLDYTSKEF